MRMAERAQMSGSRTDADRGEPLLLWGVGAVAIRLGIATPTLRTWERRYGIGPSHRTDGGHRRYSEADMDRVRLMRRLVTDGVPAQTAARVAESLDGTELEAALSAPEHTGSAPVHTDTDGARSLPAASAPPVAVATLVHAVRELDGQTLAETGQGVLEDLGVVSGWEEVFVPVLRTVGEQWSEGLLGVEAEHLATHRLAVALRDGAAVQPAPDATGAGLVLLCGAADDPHELPLLALEKALNASGVPCQCLGPRVPEDALGAAVARLDPAAVFVWASLDRDPEDATVGLLGSVNVPVLLGGPGWAERDDVERCATLSAAVSRLRSP